MFRIPRFLIKPKQWEHQWSVEKLTDLTDAWLLVPAGITYLQEAEAAGFKTPLTEAYHAAILRLTGADSLAGARGLLKTAKLISPP